MSNSLMKWINIRLKLAVSVLPYSIIKRDLKRIKILEDKETVLRIIKENKSVARFGDGEFKTVLGLKQKSFQDTSELLRDRLREVLQNDDNTIVCIPLAMKDCSKNTAESKAYWRLFVCRYYLRVKKYLREGYEYGNASFTRPYIARKNKKDSGASFNYIKEIWQDKDVLIVEGKNTKFGVGNNLLDNSKSVRRIICPSRNAFEKYDKIVKTVKRNYKNGIVLAALGQTATVLAYDLGKMGIQCVDIGHIDLEYEWFLQKTKKRVLVRGKAVNELGKNEDVGNIISEKYDEEVVARI